MPFGSLFHYINSSSFQIHNSILTNIPRPAWSPTQPCGEAGQPHPPPPSPVPGGCSGDARLPVQREYEPWGCPRRGPLPFPASSRCFPASAPLVASIRQYWAQSLGRAGTAPAPIDRQQPPAPWVLHLLNEAAVGKKKNKIETAFNTFLLPTKLNLNV